MEHRADIAAKRIGSQRHERQESQHQLDRKDEAFDDGQAAVFADGTESRLDIAALAPGLEAITPKLASFVADKVSG